MLKRFFFAAVLFLAACQHAAPTEVQIETPDIPTSEAASTASDPQWLETEMNGVRLGMWKPYGWETDLSEGLVLAEHTVAADGVIEGGMLVYVFVPPVDEFDIAADDDNVAWTVLNQVVKMPSHTGHDVTVSDPQGFDWDQYGAAYYLLSSGDGIKAMVLALTLSKDPPRVVVCNVSIPSSQANRIRSMLPSLLDGLTIDGRAFNGDGLSTLPDPLPFPHYSITANYNHQNQVSSNSAPDVSPPPTDSASTPLAPAGR